MEELIKNAKSLNDVARLEKELNNGRVPAGDYKFGLGLGI